MQVIPKLFGREPTQKVGDHSIVWRGRGWRVDVYRRDGSWRWHLCMSHERNVIVDKLTHVEHPDAESAVRSVSAVIRSLSRTAALISRHEGGG